MSRNIIASLVLLIMSSFYIMGQREIKAFHCEGKRYALKNAKGEIVSQSDFYEYDSFESYRVLRDSPDRFSYKVLVDPDFNALYQAKNADIKFHKLENETIICIHSQKKRRWKFWKWKSDYNWMANSGRLINTDAPVSVFKFYRLGDKKPFYQSSINIDKWDSYKYDFFSIKDAFVINNVLFNIKNGSVKKIRKDIVEVGKKHLVFLEKGEKPFLYVGEKESIALIDFYNKPLNNNKYKSQNFIDLEILNEAGETETKKRMELSENVYVNQKGENFLIANWELSFPRQIKYFPGDKKTERIIGSIDNAVVLPDAPYFLIYSRAIDGFYLIDKEGNWMDNEILKEYFIERNSHGGKSKLIIYKLKEEDYDGEFHIINR